MVHGEVRVHQVGGIYKQTLYNGTYMRQAVVRLLRDCVALFNKRTRYHVDSYGFERTTRESACVLLGPNKMRTRTARVCVCVCLCCGRKWGL